MRAALLLTLAIFSGLAAAEAQTAAAPPPAGPSLAEARAGIVAATNLWTRARMAGDTVTMNRALTPDFYATMNPKNLQARLTREEFLKNASTPLAGMRLTRFDSSILTLIRTPVGFEAIVQEKLEFAVPVAGGGEQRNYALWITRDGWRQVDGEWKGTYSETVGVQGWNAPARPPMTDW